jgi:G3E family GTPase
MLHDLSGVGSVGIVARGPLDEYRFNMFMRDLLAEKAKDIFRCKGVLAVHVSTSWLGWGQAGQMSSRSCAGLGSEGLAQQHWASIPPVD